jgi:DNA adenine methylase
MSRAAPRQSRIGATRGRQLSLRPPLKWAGGKRWQVPHLLQLWASHRHRRLVEPFCGGLAVTLGLLPGSALLNDINPHLINFYRWLQRGLTISVSMQNDSATYYAARVRFNELLRMGTPDSAEAASWFYYLNRTGYNGLCRFNNQGGFNVPFGRYRRIEYRRDFTEYKAVLEPYTFTHSDFQEIRLQRGDFIYADPPYDVDFTQYSEGGFAWDAQVRLAEWLAMHRGPVVLVNQKTARIEKLYRALGFAITILTAPRLISCTGDRTPAREILATRNI